MFGFRPPDLLDSHVLYPTGLYIDGGGPEGELVRYGTPDKPELVLPPLSTIMELLRSPQSVTHVKRKLAEEGIPDHVLQELLDGNWLVAAPIKKKNDCKEFTGYSLLPNVKEATKSGIATMRLVSSTTGRSVEAWALVAEVLMKGISHDVPSAVAQVSIEKQLSIGMISDLLLDQLGMLLTSSTAYLTKVEH